MFVKKVLVDNSSTERHMPSDMPTRQGYQALTAADGNKRSPRGAGPERIQR